MADADRIVGVDFSASSRDAGSNTWVAEADVTDGSLAVREVAPASEWLESGNGRESVLRGFRESLVDADPETIVGFDFPFSLPAPILVEDDWLALLERAPSLFSGPGDFQATCHRWTQLVGEGKETQRECEAEYGGLCAYNQWMYRMTYFGLVDLLWPLRLAERIAVPPFDEAPKCSGRPIIVETYPAAVLQERSIDEPGYKGSNGTRRGRETLCESLDGLPDLTLDLGDDECERLVSNDGGDALDSILAAYGVYRGYPVEDMNLHGPSAEGHIYA